VAATAAKAAVVVVVVAVAAAVAVVVVVVVAEPHTVGPMVMFQRRMDKIKIQEHHNL
jgi:hypothetical protein